MLEIETYMLLFICMFLAIKCTYAQKQAQFLVLL